MQSPYFKIDFNSAVLHIRHKLDHYQPLHFTSENGSPAAVMILLMNKGDVPHILFTKRSETVEHHKGQVSFPGGMKDRKDKDLVETGLRETREEIGIDSGQIEILGRTDDFFTVTNFLITPYVGILHPPFEYHLSTDEVAAVLEVPLSLFLHSENFEIKKWDYKGKRYDVYFYYYKEFVIWGATGFMVNRFVDLIFAFNPAPNPTRHDPRNIHYLRENIIRGGNR